MRLEESARRQEVEAKSLRSGSLELEGKLEGLEREARRLAVELDEAVGVCEVERAARVRSEKARKELAAEVDEMRRQMQGACDANAVQVELNGRYERELVRLRAEREQAIAEGAAGVEQAVKRSGEVVSGLNERIEALVREKGRWVKEERLIRGELAESVARVEELEGWRSAAERERRLWEKREVEMEGRLGEMRRKGEEEVEARGRAEAELGAVRGVVQEMEDRVGGLEKEKGRLEEALEDSRRVAGEEEASRKLVAGQLKTLQRELCLFKAQLEEEESKK